MRSNPRKRNPTSSSTKAKSARGVRAYAFRAGSPRGIASVRSTSFPSLAAGGANAAFALEDGAQCRLGRFPGLVVKDAADLLSADVDDGRRNLLDADFLELG